MRVARTRGRSAVSLLASRSRCERKARGAGGASENSSSWASTVQRHGQTGSYARSIMAPIEKTTGGTRMALQGAHQLFGDTDESSCVPDAACAPRRSGARGVSDEPAVPDAACAIGMSGEACELKASWMLGAPSSPEVFPLGDYLADAFIAWDFYADAPIPDAPFVLRFSKEIRGISGAGRRACCLGGSGGHLASACQFAARRRRLLSRVGRCGTPLLRVWPACLPGFPRSKR